MKMREECVECLYHQHRRLLKSGKLPSEIAERSLREFEKHIQTLDIKEFTPPEVAGVFYDVLHRNTAINDLYAEEKRISTEFALTLYDEFAEKLKVSSNRFTDIIKLVIAGNIIDYGADKDFTMDKARSYIANALKAEVDSAKTEKLKSLMDQAKTIFYVADNCGEVVFDRFLMGEYRDKITLGVRGKPILNDVTINELEMSQLNDFQVVSTEDNVPGVSLRKSGKEFLYHLYNSDLVIAKGQGNYESLHEIERPICHLLCIKCDVISSLVAVPKFNTYIEIRNC